MKEDKTYYYVKQEGNPLWHLTQATVSPNGTFIPNKALCGAVTDTILAKAFLPPGMPSSDHICTRCHKALTVSTLALKKHQGKSLTLAGHTFHLEGVTFGIHSEETADFSAELHCDGEKIGYMENNGHGGATTFSTTLPPEKHDWLLNIKKAVEGLPWLKCQNGTVFRQNFGVIADHLLIMEDYPTTYQTPYGNPLWVYRKNRGRGTSKTQEIIISGFPQPAAQDRLYSFILPPETFAKGIQERERTIRKYIEEKFKTI